MLGGDRVRQRQVQADRRRHRQRRGDQEARPRGDRVGVGQDPAEAVREHQRRHDGPGDRAGGRRRRPRQEGPVPAADRPAQPDDARCTQTRRRSRRRARRSSSCASSIESAKTALKQAQDNLSRQQQLWKGGLTTHETLDRAENQLKMRQSDLQLAGAADRDAAPADDAGRGHARERDSYNLSKVRIESPINGIVTRRNIEEGETVVIGTMNNAGTVLLTIADMSVIEAEVEVDETDIPNVKLGQIGEGHDRRDARQDVHRQGHRDRQQPDPGDRADAAAQATNFKVEGHARQRDSRRASRASPARRRSRPRRGTTCSRCRSRRRRSARWSSTTRANIVAGAGDRRQAAAAVRRRPGRRAEARPERARSSRACSWCSDNKAVFMPIKTGIAGDKYFEVARRASRRATGHHRAVQLGPRAGGRRAVKVEASAPGAASDAGTELTEPNVERDDEPVPRSRRASRSARSGRTSCVRS